MIVKTSLMSGRLCTIIKGKVACQRGGCQVSNMSDSLLTESGEIEHDHEHAEN